MNSIQKTLLFLTRKEKSQGLIVLLMVLGMAVLETAGVASIMPFLAVLASPEMLETNKNLNYLYTWMHNFGIYNREEFLKFLGISSFVLILFSAGYRTVTQYFMNNFIEMRRHSIGERLMLTYLRHPYEYFLNRNSADLSKSILSEVDQLVHNVIRPGYNMAAYMLIVIALTSLLLIINIQLALLTAGILGGLYALFYYILSNKLKKLGDILLESNKNRFIAAAEVFGGIKDIKLLGREQSYLSRFNSPSKTYASSLAANQTLNLVPYYLIEALVFGGILLISIVLLVNSNGRHSGTIGDIFPTLGVYAFAAYRIKPALQNVFYGFAGLRFGKAIIDNLYTEIYSHNLAVSPTFEQSRNLNVKHSITLSGITYTYPNTEKPSLDGIDIKIAVGSVLGIVGPTGAGKTTVVDVILGLLRPQKGLILVDERPITEHNLRAWQQCLGYVPQDIFLMDNTIAENIALGVPKDQIDFEQVQNSARLAQVHDFITQELPDKYDTLVGERGIRLSGGQRQRIGIARALYHKPHIMVFDEATSALDSVTEKAVMDAIDTLAHQKTIILIAHRLSTVRNCDQIALLANGSIKEIGTFDELAMKSEQFRKMIDPN